MKKVRELAMQLSGARGIQAEETASAKALSGKALRGVRETARRPE